MHPPWAKVLRLIDAARNDVMGDKTTAAAVHKAVTPQVDTILRR